MRGSSSVWFGPCNLILYTNEKNWKIKGTSENSYFYFCYALGGHLNILSAKCEIIMQMC